MFLKRDQTFRARLREERERLGFTQQEFAEKVGIKRLTQHLYEKNQKSYPNHKYYIEISELGVDLHYVLFGKRGGGEGVVLDPDTLDAIYRAVDEIAIDNKGKPLPLEARLKLFHLLYTTHADNPGMVFNFESMRKIAS
jgi:transcriptional regulator with XRE-family HTH domain